MNYRNLCFFSCEWEWAYFLKKQETEQNMKLLLQTWSVENIGLWSLQKQVMWVLQLPGFLPGWTIQPCRPLCRKKSPEQSRVSHWVEETRRQSSEDKMAEGAEIRFLLCIRERNFYFFLITSSIINVQCWGLT
jgi:hypothetical protein